MFAGMHSFISSTLVTLACDAGTATAQRWRRARRRSRWPPAEGSCATTAVGAGLWSSSGSQLLLLQLRLLLLLLALACIECRRDLCCYASVIGAAVVSGAAAGMMSAAVWEPCYG